MRVSVVLGFALLLLACAMEVGAQQPVDRFVTVNGIRIHYLDWGNDGKPPLIMLHGIGRVAHTFDHIAPHFASRYRVIAVDMRGHGDSGWDPKGAYLVEDYTKDIEGMAVELQLRNITIWGNSTGGRVAQVFAGLHPDLVAAVISEDVGPERPTQVAESVTRQLRQEDERGWASEDELLAQLKASNPRTPEEILRAYAHYGSKRRAEDGRVIWKAGSGHWKRLRSDGTLAIRQADQIADHLCRGWKKHDRTGSNAGGTEESPAPGDNRHNTWSGALPERGEH